jgi:hypothetical protein
VKVFWKRFNFVMGAVMIIVAGVMILLAAMYPTQPIGPQWVTVTDAGTALHPKGNPRTWVAARLPDGRLGEFIDFGPMAMGKQLCAFAVLNRGGWSISLRPLPDTDCPANETTAPLTSE